MKRLAFLSLTGIVALMLTLSSCHKEPQPSTGDALFEYTTNGLTVKFTNKSTIEDPKSFVWDFGDGGTSNEENPTHTYANKGEYTVKLTVTDQADMPHSVSTKIKVDKAAEITFADGSLSDWANLKDLFIPGAGAGVVTHFKMDYDVNYIYFYVEMNVDTLETMLDSSVFDILVNIDPGQGTGYTYTIFPNFDGAELLLEGGVSADGNGNWMGYATYNSSAAGGGWDQVWEYQEDEEAAKVGDVSVDRANKTVKYEFACSRDKIDILNGVDLIEVVGWVSDLPDWNERGWIPDKATDDNPNAGGITFDMTGSK